MDNVLITGSGGYLGSMLFQKMSKKFNVFHYDITFGQDILDFEKLENAFVKNKLNYVVHIAAVANLNFSIEETMPEKLSITVNTGTYVINPSSSQHVLANFFVT